MQPNSIFIDFESYYDNKAYSLKTMSLVEYIRDPRFIAHGFAYATYGSEPVWVSRENIVQELNKIRWAETTVIGHNLKFDAFILAHVYGIHPPSFHDTLAMSRAVLGRKVENYSLRKLAEYYALPPKGEMKTDGIRLLSADQENELSPYCIRDVFLCREIYKRLEPEFPESQYALMDQTIRMFVEPKLVLNVPLLEETAAKEKREKIEIFSKIGIDKSEFSSNPKFAALLEKNGYEVPTKKSPRTGAKIPALALGDPEFLDLCESEDPRLKELCKARIAAKSTLMETRSENLAAIGRTGPWPFDVEFSGAKQTHRYSGGGSSGGNAQNFTRDSSLREAVQAPKGFSLVVGDFAQVEARIVAYLSQDPGLIYVIEKMPDLYLHYGSAFFKRPVTKGDIAERKFSKTALLGLQYGMGATKFIDTVRKETGQKIDYLTSKAAVDLYRALYSHVPSLWKLLDEYISFMASGKSGGLAHLPLKFDGSEITLPSGLKLRYNNLRITGKNRFGKPEYGYDVPSKRKGEIEIKKLYGSFLLENISQALAGELCKEVMRQFGDKVVGQVHDEILLISDNPIEDRAELEEAMEKSPIWLPQLKLKADVNYGKDWLNAKHG